MRPWAERVAPAPPRTKEHLPCQDAAPLRGCRRRSRPCSRCCWRWAPRTPRRPPGSCRTCPAAATGNLPANDDDSTDLVALGFIGDDLRPLVRRGLRQQQRQRSPSTRLRASTRRSTSARPARRSSRRSSPTSTPGASARGSCTTGRPTVGGHAAFCVIWDHVGYYNERADKTNTFQALLVDQGDRGPGRRSSTTTASPGRPAAPAAGSNGFGGASAAAGYAAGDGDSAHAAVLPGSFANGALLDSNAATSLAGHSTARPARRPLPVPAAASARRPAASILRPDPRPRRRGRRRRDRADLPPGRRQLHHAHRRLGRQLPRLATSRQGAYRVTAFTGPGDRVPLDHDHQRPRPGPPRARA